MWMYRTATQAPQRTSTTSKLSRKWVLVLLVERSFNITTGRAVWQSAVTRNSFRAANLRQYGSILDSNTSVDIIHTHFLYIIHVAASIKTAS